MSELKHTPGPWRKIFGRKKWHIDADKIRSFCTIIGSTEQEGEANAELICRAPDLLEENELLKERNAVLLQCLEDIYLSSKPVNDMETTAFRATNRLLQKYAAL